jgi:hypothetical protein
MKLYINAIKNWFNSNKINFFSVLVALLFFWPQIKSLGVNAGFLYTGDVLGYYMPAMMKTHSLIHSGSWAGAIDYSLFNGGSEFFLSPNFFSYHPLLWLVCFLVPSDAMSQPLASFLLLMLVALHSYLSLLYSYKLLTRYFSFSVSMALFVAVTYTFSHYYASALGQPPFIFSTIILPWVVYQVLRYHEHQTARHLFLAALPIIFVALGGYLPLGIATLGLALLIAIFKIHFLFEDNEHCFLLKDITLPVAPFALAVLVLSPFLLAIYQYHQTTSSSAVPSLFYSAHQLSDVPQGWLKAISFYLGVQSRFYEFTLTIGLIPLSIGMIFIFSKGAYKQLKPMEWKLLQFCLVIYVLIALASFGDYSALSDLVFYFVPQVGKMHIYQRFYIFTNLLFMMAVALMLKAILAEKPFWSTRVVLALSLILMVYITIELFLGESKLKGITFNNHFLFEIFLLTTFIALLSFPGQTLAFIAATVLAVLPSLNQHYDLASGGNTLANQSTRQPLSFDGPARKSLVEFISKFNKDVIKYVDLTPMWGSGGFEPFFKDYPYFLINEKRLSSYGGFTFYLSAKASYLERMPVQGESVVVKPDWEYLRNTGADFAVVTAQNLAENPYLQKRVQTAKPGEVLSLPGGVMAIPLDFSSDSDQVLFDNGFFRVHDSLKKSNFVNLALNKPATQSSTIGNAEAKFAVDGSTDGDFARGSVTHTSQEPNAWLEVDLGHSQRIDAIRIWNRTDCCSHRLDNFTVFVSDTPFLPTDTAQALLGRAQTWSQQASQGNPKITIKTGGVQGRFVRLQFNAQAPKGESFLHVAELQVLQSNSDSSSLPSVSNTSFSTNFSSATSFTYEATLPTSLQYLFWPNPRLTFTIDGVKAPLVENDGMHFLEVPAGRHSIQVNYTHWGLRLFLSFMLLFCVSSVWLNLPHTLRARISKWVPSLVRQYLDRLRTRYNGFYNKIAK